MKTPLKVHKTVSGWASVSDANGIEIIQRVGGNAADEIALAANEHAALVAVADATERAIHGAPDSPWIPGGAIKPVIDSLNNLAAVRANIAKR